MGKFESPKNKIPSHYETDVLAKEFLALFTIIFIIAMPFIVDKHEEIIFPEPKIEPKIEIRSSGSVSSFSIDYSDINKK